MSWKLAVCGIAVMVTVCAGFDCVPVCVTGQGTCVEGPPNYCQCKNGFTGTTCNVKDTKISTISRQLATQEPERAIDDMLLKVCSSDVDLTDSSYTKLILGIGSTSGQANIEKTYQLYTAETPPNDNKCKYFLGDIKEYKGKPIFLTLQGLDNEGGPLVHGEATFDLLPAEFFEDGDVTSQSVGFWSLPPNPALTADSLRLKLNKGLDTWKLCVNGVINENILCDSTGKICYAIGVGDETKEYSLCIKQGDAILNTVILPTTKIGSEESDPESVLLTYDSPPKMTITTSSANTLEFVPYKVDNTILAVCSGVVPCDLTTYTKSNAEMNILIVNGEANDMSNIITFKDYNIKGTNLGGTIIEMYWKRGEKKFYQAALDDQTVAVHEVAINCSEDDVDNAANTYCYAYFVGLTPAQEYTVTVIPAATEDIMDLKPIVTNQIITDPITPHESSRKQVMGITLLQHPSHADGVLQVCYKASESNYTTTRYEAIILDQAGHWMKIHQSSQGEDLVHCFSSIDVFSSSLRIDKDTKLTAVVVERELDSNQVLASGQAEIDLSALRVIQPEVDNSSEGSTGTLAIVGAAIGGVACLMALVAAAILVVIKRKRSNDGLQYPLQRSNVKDSNIIHGLDNPNSTN